MQHYYISKSWMVSTTAQWIYRRAAWLSLGLVVMLFAIPFLEGIHGFWVPIIRLAFYACVLGAAITIVAMEYFLFSFDPSSSGKKGFWFLVMCLPLLGAALYCLVAYSRSPILDANREPRPEMLGEEFRGSR